MVCQARRRDAANETAASERVNVGSQEEWRIMRIPFVSVGGKRRAGESRSRAAASGRDRSREGRGWGGPRSMRPRLGRKGPPRAREADGRAQKGPAGPGVAHLLARRFPGADLPTVVEPVPVPAPVAPASPESPPPSGEEPFQNAASSAPARIDTSVPAPTPAVAL